MHTTKDYIDDPSFLKWIFRPDDSTEQDWENYMESHPDEKPGILSLKEELGLLKLKNEDLSDREKKLLIETVLKKKERGRSHPVSRVLRPSFFRYAAIAVIFLALGNLLTYLFRNETEKPENYAGLTYLLPADKPALLLADGQEIDLEKNSTVEYTGDHTVVVDGRTFAVSPGKLLDQAYDQVVTPRGYRCKMILSDRSVIHLNAGSNLIYPPVFNGDEREVILSGEAFFEVSRNRHSPFIVQTHSVDVAVFGTKFDVSAYAEDPVIRTVLVEGEVAVKRNDMPSPAQPIMMKPEQMVTYNRQTHDFETSRVDPQFFTLWKDGMLKFEEEELSLVIRKLERFYNMTVIFRDREKGHIRISGKLDLNENKYQVFEYLKTLTGMQFNELNDTYYVIN